jgi:major vault protein
MINGPIRFTPPVEVKILSVSSIIPLDKNEGIYVRNIKTGKVFKHMGSSYSLKPDEILWEKELPANVEQIYLRDGNLTKRDKTRIVAYKCPFNAIIQIYNMKEKTSRIVFGPDLAVLDPDEEFTLMSLSGKTPKIANQIKTLYLNLGPVFSSDQFDVETVDHTRLKLKVAYLWQFNISRGEDAEALKIFTMTDFIGDMCLTMASKIRSFVATLTFEDFHKNSDRLIKRAVFGENERGEINTQICYEDCRLVINDVDIQSVIPTDPTTQNLLSQSVSLAIELATKTIEQEYVIAALIKEQEFKGEVEKLKISNEIDYLNKLQDYSKLKIESKIIETTGLSRAHALAVKEASVIESRSKVKLAEMTKIASDIETEFDIKKKKKQNESKY